MIEKILKLAMSNFGDFGLANATTTMSTAAANEEIEGQHHPMQDASLKSPPPMSAVAVAPYEVKIVAPQATSRDALLRITTLIASCLVMSAAGSLYAFSIFSDGLRGQLGFTSSDVNVISAVGNTALYLSFLVIGPFFDRMGATATMVLATVTYTAGYALMWAAYDGNLGSPSVASMAGAYFLAGFGSTAAYMATIGVNVVNFPAKYTGMATGILLLFYGISGTIYSQIFSAWYSSSDGSNVGGYLLFLTLSVAIVNSIGCITIFSRPYGKSVVLLDGAKAETGHVVVDTAKPQLNSENVKDKDIPATIQTVTGTDSTDDTDANADASMSPLSILKSPFFWLYAMVCIWQQGLTFVTNVTTILQAISPADVSAGVLAKQGALHVTVISIGQSAGRFFFGAISDVVADRFGAERSTLLIFSEALLVLPHLLLSVLSVEQLAAQSGAVLYLCSICIGIGWGAAGALFPPLTRDLFGTAFYGTACAFLMMGVPIGILISNLVFGGLYDAALSKQAASGAATSGSICRGTDCFAAAFQISLGIQVIPIVTSILLFVLRTRSKRQKTKKLARTAPSETV